MVTKPSKIQDLDIDTIVTSDKHDKDFSDLNKRLCALEEKFGTNELVAATLCVVSEKAAQMQEMFVTGLLKAIRTDERIQTALDTAIRKADRNWFYATLSRFGKVGWAIMLLIVGAIAKTLSDKYLH